MANKTLRVNERYQIRKGPDGTLLYSQDGVKWLTPTQAHIVDFDKLDVTVDQIEAQMQLMQDAIDLINSTTTIMGSVETYADLLVLDTTSLIPGDSYIVLSDEEHGGGTSMYVFENSEWTYVGPFGINLADYYTKTQVDALIAGVDTGVMSVNGKVGPAVTIDSNDIHFDDGENFQEKYESGELKGEKGDQGETAVVFQPEAPVETDVLWVDTDDPLNLYMPAGGLAGRVLKKNSNADYDTIWAPVTKADINLANVDNTSDADKPVSNATQTALNAKVDKTSTTQRIYATNSTTGDQVLLKWADSQEADTVARRTIGGQLRVGTPVLGEAATTKTYVDTALAGKLNKSGADTSVYVTNSAGEDMTIQYLVSAVGNSIPRRNANGELYVATPVNSAAATTKSYVDSADALKVNKAGDTMTGQLISANTGAVGYAHTRSGWTTTWGTASTGRYVVTQPDTIVGMSLSNNGLRIGDDGALAQQKLDVIGNARINGVDIITGTGFPNGVVSAPVGSTYIDTNATNGAVEWKKATGTGNTGWVVSVGDTGWRNCNALLGVFWNTTGAFRLRRIGDVVYVRIADLSVAASPTGARNSLRSITDNKWPVGFRHESWGTTAFTQVGVAGFPGCITPSADIHDLGVRVFTALTSSNWVAGDNVGGHFDYPVTSGWPSTLPGTPL